MENTSTVEQVTPVERLGRWMKEEGISQKALGVKIGVSERSVSRLMNGFLPLSSRMITKICDAYDLPRQWLLRGEDEEVLGVVRPGMAIENMALWVMAGRQFAY